METRDEDGRSSESRKERPDHYRVVCISLYREDLERVDRIVRELKARGQRRASRSSVIRHALVEIERKGVPIG